MLRKALLAAGTIFAVVCLTACGSGNKQSDANSTETTSEIPTAIAQNQTTTAAETATTTTKAAETATTTTKATEKETTTKAVEKETTTRVVELEVPAAAQEEEVYDESDDYYDTDDEDSEVYSGIVAADGDGLTLRSGPDSDYDYLTVVPDGTEVEILEEEDGWGYVSYDGVEGWIYLGYVE